MIQKNFILLKQANLSHCYVTVLNNKMNEAVGTGGCNYEYAMQSNLVTI